MFKEIVVFIMSAIFSCGVQTENTEIPQIIEIDYVSSDDEYHFSFDHENMVLKSDNKHDGRWIKNEVNIKDEEINDVIYNAYNKGILNADYCESFCIDLDNIELILKDDIVWSRGTGINWDMYEEYDLNKDDIVTTKEKFIYEWGVLFCEE